MSGGGRILAIDHGAARCGCAVCDPSGTIVRPIEAIEPTEAEAVARVARAQGAEEIVLGLPVSLNGEEGAQARVVRGFGEELAALLDEIPVSFFDERFTTRQAQESRRGGASAAEDSLAAAHLLEAYLLTREAARR